MKSQKIYPSLVIFMVLLLSSFSQAASHCVSARMKNGTESSGGGTVFKSSNGPVLIDLLQINPQARIQPTDAWAQASYIERAETALILEKNPYLGSNEDPAVNFALTILKKWDGTSARLGDISILSAIQHPLAWVFTDGALPDCLYSKNLNSLELQFAAYYIRDRYQVNIFRPLWNQMDLISQSGLIIHESLRHIQLDYERVFNEESLQQTTALLLLCEPNEFLKRYTQHVLINPASAREVFGSFSDVLKSCQKSSLLK